MDGRELPPANIKGLIQINKIQRDGQELWMIIIIIQSSIPVSLRRWTDMGEKTLGPDKATVLVLDK